MLFPAHVRIQVALRARSVCIFRCFSMSVSPKLLRIGEKRMVAYRNVVGRRSPGVVFLSGYNSTMDGIKATALEGFCAVNGHPYVRFDYEGCGASSGEFSQQTLSVWKEDAIGVLDGLTHGPQVIVGSSMGGWLGCLIAMERPEKVRGLVGICPAINFINEIDKKVLDRQPDGSKVLSGPYGEDLSLSKSLLEDSEKHAIDLNYPISIHCGVRLIHGMEDVVVPYQTSIQIMNQLASKDAELILLKSGEHRMSEPRDIDVLIQAVSSLLTLAPV